jgi:hypothetical protein
MTVYKITFPNGKIYIGQDRTDSLTYFGSASSELVAKDFTLEQMQDFTVRKQVLWYSPDATATELSAQERRLILEHRSNDPTVGYNRWPRFIPQPVKVSTASPSD